MDEYATTDVKAAGDLDGSGSRRESPMHRVSQGLTRFLASGLFSVILCGCGTTVVVQGGGFVDPPPGPTLTTIGVTFKNDKCVLDLNIDRIVLAYGETHYWSLVPPGPPRSLPVTFDDNGIDIAQLPVLHDFVMPTYSPSRKGYSWKANSIFTTGAARPYEVHVTWTKPDGTKAACVSTDPYIVNRGASASQ